MRSIEILDRLIGFETVSRRQNRDLIQFAHDLLREIGADVTLVPNEGGDRMNLYATIGPRDRPGVLLSGHTDVVPVEGQNWSVPPFTLTQKNGQLIGRGTADMKGFIASALLAAEKAARADLTTPLHLALSYDEEIGCIGVRSMIDMLADAPFRPLFCIVGEPTSLNVATGHKGKIAARARCVGREGHSALAPFALNAIHLATDFVSMVRGIQSEIADHGQSDDSYDVPYTTLHVGRISGGVALNIVPNLCTVDFEIRNLAGDDADAILDRVRSRADAIVAKAKKHAEEAAIEIEITNTYPGLDTPEEAAVVSFVRSLTGANAPMKVAFGTEGGLFSARLGVPTVVCGPGSMAQGHRPDEFITVDDLLRCDAMMDALIGRLVDGIA